jgi:hypothetical protein
LNTTYSAGPVGHGEQLDLHARLVGQDFLERRVLALQILQTDDVGHGDAQGLSVGDQGGGHAQRDNGQQAGGSEHRFHEGFLQVG